MYKYFTITCFLFLSYFVLNSCKSDNKLIIPASCWKIVDRPQSIIYIEPLDSLFIIYGFRNLGNCRYSNTSRREAQVLNSDRNELTFQAGYSKNKLIYHVDSILIYGIEGGDSDTFVLKRNDDCEFLKKLLFKTSLTISDHFWQKLDQQSQMIEDYESRCTLDTNLNYKIDRLDEIRQRILENTLSILDLRYSCESRNIDLGMLCFSSFTGDRWSYCTSDIGGTRVLIEQDDLDQFPLKFVSDEKLYSSDFTIGEVMIYYNQLKLYLYKKHCDQNDL